MGRPISRWGCSSGILCSPYQRFCQGLAAGTPGSSHHHSTHTLPSPAAGTDQPPPPQVYQHLLQKQMKQKTFHLQLQNKHTWVFFLPGAILSPSLGMGYLC